MTLVEVVLTDDHAIMIRAAIDAYKDEYGSELIGSGELPVYEKLSEFFAAVAARPESFPVKPRWSTGIRKRRRRR